MVAQVEFGNYDGAVDKWKIRLAISRIRAFKLPRDDWEDALQEIVIAIYQFEFDPAKSNGAKESTALCGLINNVLLAMVRAHHRRQRRMEQYTATVSIQVDRETGEVVDDHEDDPAIRLDVAAILAGMTPIQREVCIRRARGDSLRKIARQMGLRWRQLCGILKAVHRKFQHAGLDGRMHG
ncbi:MAG: hypothetical protein NTV86_23905 [Planctomycetota bacterium]|nr:hypothetical protein [Planctomycetota bacterium]